MAALKTCFKCGAEKPRTEFYRHPAMADGLLGKCKPCTRKDVRETRLAKHEYYKAYDIARYRNNEARRAQARASFTLAQERYPDRKRAAEMVAKAIKSGQLVRQPCFVCGEKAQAHHPDYSAPLDVVWLCVMHHRQAHGLVRRIDEKEAA